jgi:hypothetical protein
MAEIRFHLDEHMDAAIAIGLRRRGIDVTTTNEAKLLRASDRNRLHSRLLSSASLSLGSVASRRRLK